MPRFHLPLLEPDVQISRIRLSSGPSSLRIRPGRTTVGDREEPQVLVQVAIRVTLVTRPATLLPSHQPPAESPLDVSADHAIRPDHWALVEVPTPPAKDGVEYLDPLRGLLPVPAAGRLLMEPGQELADRLLRRPGADVRPTALAVVAPDRVAEEVERLLW